MRYHIISLVTNFGSYRSYVKNCVRYRHKIKSKSVEHVSCSIKCNLTRNKNFNRSLEILVTYIAITHLNTLESRATILHYKAEAHLLKIITYICKLQINLT